MFSTATIHLEFDFLPDLVFEAARSGLALKRPEPGNIIISRFRVALKRLASLLQAMLLNNPARIDRCMESYSESSYFFDFDFLETFNIWTNCVCISFHSRMRG